MPGIQQKNIFYPGILYDPATGIPILVVTDGGGGKRLGVDATFGGIAIVTAVPEAERVSGTISLTGAAPVAGFTSGVFGSAGVGKIKRILIVRTTTGASPYTSFDVEIFAKDPSTIAGLTAALNHDGINTEFLATELVPVASGAPAGSFKILNQVPVAEICFRNLDSPATFLLYVRVRGTAGGAVASTDIISVIVDGEEQNP